MDPERPPTTQASRTPSLWAWIAAAALVAFAAGFGVGGLVLSNGSDQASPPQGAQGVPAVCLRAIEAARQQLGLRSEAVQLPEAYVSLAQRAVGALQRGDTKALENITADLQALNDQAQSAIQGMLGDSFTRPAQECEALSPGAPPTAAATATG